MTDKMVVHDRIAIQHPVRSTTDPSRIDFILTAASMTPRPRTPSSSRSSRQCFGGGGGGGGFGNGRLLWSVFILIVLNVLIGVEAFEHLLPMAPPPETSIDAYQPLREQESKFFLLFVDVIELTGSHLCRASLVEQTRESKQVHVTSGLIISTYLVSSSSSFVLSLSLFRSVVLENNKHARMMTSR